MPNTLAHLGIQGFTTRGLLPGSDLKWIYIGCIIPDLPWILQRIVNAVTLPIDRYDLLLYCSVQSSLMFCLILSAAFAAISRSPSATMLVLAMNSVFHLLLDATQIKWANGVMLFAPINWKLTHFDLYWPESLPTICLTLFGLCYILLMWRKACPPALWIKGRNRFAVLSAVILFMVYALAPTVFMQGPLEIDNYYSATLMHKSDRPGKEIAFDHAFLEAKDTQVRIRNFNDEWFYLEGVEDGLDSCLISLEGRFITANRIRVTAYHLHPGNIRAAASIIGLSLVLLLWASGLYRTYRWHGKP